MRNVKENSFLVYQHTNLINGKIYIGITFLEAKDRWRKGNGYYSNAHFYNAIQKYGWNNFKHEILFSNLTQQEACEIEIELIAFHKSNLSKFGYNGSTGGEYGHSGCKHSIESRKKMSENHANFRGVNSKQSVPIICLDTKEIFASIGEAERKIGIDKRGIHHVLKGKLKSYHGLHFIYLKDYNPDKEYDLSVGHTDMSYCSKQIVCEEYNRVFNSVISCARELNINRCSISNVLSGKSKTAGGLHFKYYIGEK